MPLSTLGLFLTLLASLAWASFDAMRKGLARRVDPPMLVLWLPLIQAPLLAIWAATTGPVVLPKACWGPMGLSVLLNVAALLWFMQALRSSPMSQTVPLLSFTPVGTTLLGWAFRHQTPTTFQVGGVAVVVAGALVLGLKSSQWPGLRAYAKDPGVRRMLGAALAWSFTAVVDQTALSRGAGYWYAPALCLGVSLVLAVYFLGSGHLAAIRKAGSDLMAMPALSAFAIVVGAAALAVQLESLRLVPVGLNETVKRGIGMAGAVLSGRLFFHESVTAQKILAVVLLTVGVGLVVAGR